MMKKLVALLMALALLCSSISVFAEEEPVAEPVEAAAEEVVVEDEEVVEEATEEPALEGTEEEGKEDPDKYKTERYNVKVDLVEAGLELVCKPHTLAWEDVKSATEPKCIEDGYRYFRCAECGQEFFVVIDALGHEDLDPADTAILEGDAATCTKTGTRTHYGCARCGKDTVWTSVIPMKQHDEGKPVVTPADCVNPEKLVYTCINCGQVRTEVREGTELKHAWDRTVDPDGNPYEYVEKDIHVAETATCMKDGSIGNARVCDFCGYVDKMDTVQIVEKPDHQKYLDANHDYIYTKDEDDKVTVAAEIKEGESTLPARTVGTIVIEGETVVDEEGNPVPQYSYGALKVEYTKPTCTTAGSITVTCVDCGAKLHEDLPELGHDYVEIGESQEGKQVTDCTKANSILFKCSRCKIEFNQAFTPAKEHLLSKDDEGNILNEVDHYTQKKATDAEAVKYTDKDQLAKCIPYIAYYKCKVGFCKCLIPVEVKATEKHDAGGVYIINDAATCTEDGRQLYNCAKCGFTQDIPQTHTGHNFDIPGKDKVASTCQIQGTRVMKCSNPGCTATTEIKMPTIDHHYVVTTSITEPDCTKGEHYLVIETCIMCNDVRKDERLDVDGHVLPTNPKDIDTHPATCTKNGTQQFYCTKCHKDVTRILPATGHSFEYEDNDKTKERIGQDAFIEAHEAACGGTSKDSILAGYKCTPATCKNGAASGTKHTLECTECGEPLKWTEDDQPEGHTMFKVTAEGEKVLNNFVLDTANLPTCDTPGKAWYKCSVCNETQELVLPAIGHNAQLYFNTDTGAYEYRCMKLANDENAYDRLTSLMENNGYKDMMMVADAVADQLCNTKGANIAGFGCDYVKPIDIRKTEYTIERLSATRGAITLVEGALPAKGDVYVRIMWRYEFESGDTFAYVDCRPVTLDESLKTGTFKLSGGQTSATLIATAVEVVTDPDADSKIMGGNNYDVYGSDVL